MISADDVIATLAFLIPGFVALKIVYWFGQRTKRADWEWTLWSVLVSAPIAFAADRIATVLGSTQVDLAKAIGDCGLVSGAGKTGADLQAAVATCATNALSSHNADLRLAIALIIAVAGGLAAVVVWRVLIKMAPRLRERASLQAWDAVLASPHWVQVKVDDLIYFGKVDIAADPVESDDLDIYIKQPSLISGNQRTRLDQTEGILIARDKIEWIQVIKPA